MRTDGKFTTETYRITVQSSDDDIFIVPFSDVHFGAEGFCKDAWREFTDWGKKQTNAYYIGDGDYLDCLRSTTRKAFQENSEEEELVYFDEHMYKLLGDFRKEIEFMRGKLIGLGSGNHGWDFRDRRNDSETLANDMGCPYLGVMSAIRIIFDYNGGYVPITYVQHHGTRSGARTAGGKFNATEWMSRAHDAEIVATGDDHKLGITRGTTRVRYIHDNKGKLIPREYTPLLVRTGGFLRILIPGAKNYGIDANLGPLPLGVNAIRIRIRRRKDEDGKKVLRCRMGAYDVF